MAIFAKKKDGRRQNQGAMGGAVSTETVRLEIPERHANDGVLTKANLPAMGPDNAQQSTRTGAPADSKTDGKADGNTDARTDARVEAQVDVQPGHTAGSPADASAGKADGAVAKDPMAAESTAATVDAEPIEPVDIEPEVIEAPVETPPAFGIEDAIRLMRSLPADPNIDLVVRVVRVTLGAVKVSVEEIMRDAEKKELKVRESIAALENEVADLEKSLHEKRAAIATHQADLRETATVRERLHMADKYTPHPPPLPPGVARVPLPKPREWDSFDADTPFKDSSKGS